MEAAIRTAHYLVTGQELGDLTVDRRSRTGRASRKPSFTIDGTD